MNVRTESLNDKAAIRGMRSRLPSLLLTGVFLILLMLLAYQLWLSYRSQVRAAEVSTSNFAEIFEARLDAVLRRTDADLKAISLEIPRAALSQKAIPLFEQALNVSLKRRLFNVEKLAGYYIHDANGDSMYSSDGIPAHQVNIADRPYFQLLRDDPGANLVVSNIVINRLTKRPVLVIGRALRDMHGGFLGVVLGLLDVDSYKNQFQFLETGLHGIVSLRRSNDHSALILWPDRPGELTSSFVVDTQIMGQVLPGGKQVTLHHEGQHGRTPRVISLKGMKDYPFYVIVAVSLDEVLAGWYTQVRVVSLSTLLLLGFIGALLFRLGRMRVREAGILTNLAQSEMQFSELAQMVPVGICHFDENGKCTFVNDRHLVLAGRRREELLNSHWSDFVLSDDHRKVLLALRRKGGAKSVCICEYRLFRPDGELVHVIGEIKIEISTEGKVLGFIVAQTDITLRKRAEAELLLAKQEAEKANITKTRFLAAASHDLRQPIQAINLFRDALSRTELSEEQKNITNFLSKSVNSLGEMLYSLLDISKLDAGLVKPQMKKVSVDRLINVVDDEFSTIAVQKSLRFKLFYPFKGMALLTDAGLLMCVLRNLIDNAFKYTESGGVLVGVRKRGARGIIQVWDTGIGIDPGLGDKIFDECFQVSNPVHDRTKGLGIGLSIARRMARLIDGDVSFRSRVGSGTVFEISLPLANDHEVFERATLPYEQPEIAVFDESNYPLLRGWKVVVIEDDPVVAKSIELSLQSLGIFVKVFPDAEMALAEPTILEADFYISDFILPGLNGLLLLESIRQRSEGAIDAVLMTGETLPRRVELASASRWTVLFKPTDLSKLLAVMSNAAESRQR